MLTLAQRIINGTEINVGDAPYLTRLQGLLAPGPTTTVLEATRLAERFVFHEDPAYAIEKQMQANMLTMEQVLSTARPLTSPMWCEYPDWQTMPNSIHSDKMEPLRYGFLIEHTHSSCRFTSTVARDSQQPCNNIRLCYDLEMPITFPWGFKAGLPGTQVEMRLHAINLAIFPDAQPIRDQMLSAFLKDEMLVIFTLCTPRVVKTVDAQLSRPVKRRQLREHPNKPLIEFKTVHMQIGSAVAHGSTPIDPLVDTTNRDIIHRRLHKVLAHYRHYTEGRPEPHISFIPEHWRGDPKLGIVLHSREIDPKEPKP